MKIGKLIWVSNDFEGRNNHNAFTDIKKFGSIFYLAFRTGSRHIDKRDGEIKVFARGNYGSFIPMKFPEMSGDMRDPHFFDYGGKAALKFILVNDETPATFFSVLDDDGSWGEPVKFKDEFVGWRPINFNGHLYVPGYRHGKEVKKKCKDDSRGKCIQPMGSRVYVGGKEEIIDPDPASNETELFGYGGELYAIVRVEGKYARMFKRSRDKWKFLYGCGHMIQGPCVKVVGNRIFVSGRETRVVRDYLDNKDKLNELLHIMELDLKKGAWIDSHNVIEGVNLDCGYSGLEIINEKKLMMSMYAGNNYGANVMIFEVDI